MQHVIVLDPSPILSKIGEAAVRRVGLSVLKHFLNWYYCK